MTNMNANKSGLVLGCALGGWHLGWAILLAIGWAQALMDFVFRIHFLSPAWTVGPFQLGTAVLLVLFTGFVGYFFGYTFALLWNWLLRPAAPKAEHQQPSAVAPTR